MTSIPVTLLLTRSADSVSDVLVTKLGTEQVFRYNSDLWQEYKLRVTGQTIELENAAGRSVTDADVVKVYRRPSAPPAAFQSNPSWSDEERYIAQEVWTAWNDLVSLFWAAGKLVLVQPYASGRPGKLQQLRVASRYFTVTPFSFLINRADALRPGVESVAKSFTFNYGANDGFYSRKVREDQLDPTCPWFLTDLIKAHWDVTVAVVRDRLFAFALDRDAFLETAIDWRQAPEDHARGGWNPIDLPPSIASGIFAFMRDAGAHYARLDFLREGNNYVFLEANFTGEWGWLDPEGHHGLREKILHEIDPRTPRISCPRIEWT